MGDTGGDRPIATASSQRNQGRTGPYPCTAFFAGSPGGVCRDTRRPGDRVGYNWRIPNVQGTRAVRHVVYDTNF